jgi:acetyl-CoA synthetase
MEWQPSSDYLDRSQIRKLLDRFNVSQFDELYDLSISEPERYWKQVTEFCGIRWSKAYEKYCDTSRGAAFPSWFVGGELNWVDTILDNQEAKDRTAIIAENENGRSRIVTYRELGDEVRGFAAGLLASGVKRGDRVGLLVENGVEANVSLLSIAYIGAVVVPLFSGFGVDAIADRLTLCDARALIATSGFHRRGRFVSTVETIAAVRERVPALELLILKSAVDESATARKIGFDFVEWNSLRLAPGKAPPSARMSPNDPFMVIFTSGTTGKPKGAVHVHGGFPVKLAHDAVVHFNVGPGDVFCWPADMGWIAGSIMLCSALLRGATLVCYDGAPDYPDWSRMGSLIERYRATHFGSTPTLIRGLAANEETALRPDISSIRMLMTAGEAIAPEHFDWFQQNFGRGECPLINYTGGTEVSGGLLSSVVVKPIVSGGFNARSPGVAVDVVDPAGKPLTGEVGELAIFAPFVGMTSSFWKDDARYLETYWQNIDGMWIHGDLALRTPDDHYFILGRSDDTIKVAGKRVGPAEVEEILAKIDGVVEAAVIGADDPVKGQVLVAFLICRDAPNNVREVAATMIQEGFGRPFAPRAVFVVPDLPKTRSLKILRRVIRSIYSGAPAGDLTSLVNPDVVPTIKRIVQEG